MLFLFPHYKGEMQRFGGVFWWFLPKLKLVPEIGVTDSPNLEESPTF